VPLIDPLFREADQGARELVTSALTLLELLVVPYRAGNHLLADRHETLLTRSRGIRLVDLSRDQLRAAALIPTTRPAVTGECVQLRTVRALISGDNLDDLDPMPALGVSRELSSLGRSGVRRVCIVSSGALVGARRAARTRKIIS
jgi:hypothetical protein